MHTASSVRTALVASAFPLVIAASVCNSPTASTCAATPAAVSCVTGSYVLTQVNGQALPAFIDASKTVQWSAGTLVLASDQSLTGSVTWTSYSGSTVTGSGTQQLTGTWASTGATTLSVTLTGDPAGRAILSSDGSLIIISRGLATTFGKQ